MQRGYAQCVIAEMGLGGCENNDITVCAVNMCQWVPLGVSRCVALCACQCALDRWRPDLELELDRRRSSSGAEGLSELAGFRG